MNEVSKMLAAISVILTGMVSGIYLLRVIGKQYKSNHWVNRWNRNLRKCHKFLSVLLVAVTLIHGITSFTGVFKLTWGIISWIMLLLLGLSYCLKRKLGGNWIKLHRVLTLVFLVLLLLHLVELRSLREL